MKNQR